MKRKRLLAINIAAIVSLGLVSAVQAEGNVSNGKTLYAACASCHGMNAEGNQTLNAPRLNHLQDLVSDSTITKLPKRDSRNPSR